MRVCNHRDQPSSTTHMRAQQQPRSQPRGWSRQQQPLTRVHTDTHHSSNRTTCPHTAETPLQCLPNRRIEAESMSPSKLRDQPSSAEHVGRQQQLQPRPRGFSPQQTGSCTREIKHGLSEDQACDAIDAGIAAAMAAHVAAAERDGAPAGALFELLQCATPCVSIFANELCAEAVHALRQQLKLDDAVPILALVLIDRAILATSDRRLVTHKNWRAVLATAISLAVKVCSDEAPSIGAIQDALGIAHLRLGLLEARMSDLIGFHLHVSLNLFLEYELALHTLGLSALHLDLGRMPLPAPARDGSDCGDDGRQRSHESRIFDGEWTVEDVFNDWC